MTLKFTDNYNLFVIYLILNLSGYDDENNKKGMHPIRKKIRYYFRRYKKDDIKIIEPIRKLLKKIHCNSIAYTGLLKRERPKVRKFKGLDEALSLIKKFEENTKLKEFYTNYYLPNLDNIINNKKFRQKLTKYERDISDFVEIKTNWKISVVVNFLDAYWRGANYRLSENYSIVTTGPDIQKIINWHNIVHETLHCILRVYFKKAEKKFSPKLIKIIKQKTLDKDYKNNTPMHQIEETIVRAFTPLITNENKLGYWDYLKNRFPLTEPIYKILKGKLVKGKIKFNQKILGEILEKIEKFPSI